MAKSESDSQIVKKLKQWKQKDITLHDHFCQLLNNVSLDKMNGLLHFERISQYFKKVRFNHKEGLNQAQIIDKVNQRINYPNWLAQEQQTITRIKKAQFETNSRIIQNFQRQSQTLFQPAGISFGSDQNYKINLALKMLAQKQNAVNLRFWGKIATTSGDYFVIQGVCKKNKQPSTTEGMQKYRQGVNYYSFWVSQNTISENWYELPLITPEQIRISRQIKYIFTGRLKQKITSYPVFPGEERHLLKCQLVRITHNCQIVPNGLYSKLQQNPDEIQFSEQFKMPEFNDLTNLENWVHLNPYILALGRANYYKDPKLTEQQWQEQLAKIQQSDPKIERLKGINEDKAVEKLAMEGCWVAKQIGSLQIFNGKQDGATSCYASVVLRNPHWPGWITVANAKNFASIYIGYGYKFTQESFYPISPQDLDVQGVQIDEFDEPNPKNPPDELQPDSDQQNKKPQDS